jgi:hypothetical protein
VTRSGTTLAKKLLLGCGIASALLYVVMNIVTPMLYPGYSAASQTVSELSAIGAPSRAVWAAMGLVYAILITAFGIGVWLMGTQQRALRVVGAAFAVQGILDPFWPPMHQRVALAAGGATISDTLHIAFTLVWFVLVVTSLTFGAAAMDKPFRIYTAITAVLLLAAGAMTGIDAPGMQANLPTPWIGVWERLSIGIFLLWQVMLSVQLLRTRIRPSSSASPRLPA